MPIERCVGQAPSGWLVRQQIQVVSSRNGDLFEETASLLDCEWQVTERIGDLICFSGCQGRAATSQ
jgi:hypothetical protein